MRAPRRLAGGIRLSLGALATFGTTAGHVLAYWIVAPDPHVRSELLYSTGHRRWDIVTAVAMGALVAGIARAVPDRIDDSRAYPAAVAFRGAALRLIVYQAGTFSVLEAAERVLVAGGHSPLGAKIMAIGLLMQVLTAVLVAAVLMTLRRAVDYLSRCSTGGPAAGKALTVHRQPSTTPVPVRDLGGAPEPRGPPRPAPVTH